MAKVRLIQYSGPIVAANTTNYLSIGDASATADTTEANRQVTYRSAGVLKELYFRVGANNLTGATTLTNRVNGADVNLTISVASATTGVFENTGVTDSIAVADKVCLKVVTVGTAGNILTGNSYAVTFESTTNTVKKHRNSGSINYSTASTTSYQPLAGQIASSTIEADNQYKIRIGGTLSKLFAYISANARTTATTFRSRKNTANGGMSVSVGSTATGVFEDTTNSDTLVAADLTNFSSTTGTGTQTLTLQGMGAEFSSTASQFFFLGAIAQGSSVTASTTKYTAAGGTMTNVATESDAKAKMSFDATASNLFIRIKTNAATASSTATFRKSGSSGNLTLSIAAAGTGIFEDTTHSDALIGVDDINVMFVAGTGGTLLPDMAGVAITTAAGIPPKPIKVIKQAVNRATSY